MAASAPTAPTPAACHTRLVGPHTTVGLKVRLNNGQTVLQAPQTDRDDGGSPPLLHHWEQASITRRGPSVAENEGEGTGRLGQGHRGGGGGRGPGAAGC